MRLTSSSLIGGASSAMVISIGLPSRMIFSMALPPSDSLRIMVSKTSRSPGCEAWILLPLTGWMMSPTLTPALSAA